MVTGYKSYQNSLNLITFAFGSFSIQGIDCDKDVILIIDGPNG